MPPPILVAGLDARSLLLEVPLLVREGHTVEARPTARALLLTSCARARAWSRWAPRSRT